MRAALYWVVLGDDPPIAIDKAMAKSPREKKTEQEELFK